MQRELASWRNREMWESVVKGACEDPVKVANQLLKGVTKGAWVDDVFREYTNLISNVRQIFYALSMSKLLVFFFADGNIQEAELEQRVFPAPFTGLWLL